MGARGQLLRMFAPGSAVNVETLILDDDLRVDRIGAFVAGEARGRRVAVPSDEFDYNREWLDWAVRIATVAPSLRTVLDASWVVVFRVEPHAPMVELPTDAHGVYAILRDRSGGAGRRSALLHWVSGHARAVGRHGSASVRRHLRGVHRIDWRGIDVRISPPVDDLDSACTTERRPPPSVIRAVERYREMYPEAAA